MRDACPRIVRPEAARGLLPNLYNTPVARCFVENASETRQPRPTSRMRHLGRTDQAEKSAASPPSAFSRPSGSGPARTEKVEETLDRFAPSNQSWRWGCLAW